MSSEAKRRPAPGEAKRREKIMRSSNSIPLAPLEDKQPLGPRRCWFCGEITGKICFSVACRWQDTETKKPVCYPGRNKGYLTLCAKCAASPSIVSHAKQIMSDAIQKRFALYWELKQRGYA